MARRYCIVCSDNLVELRFPCVTINTNFETWSKTFLAYTSFQVLKHIDGIDYKITDTGESENIPGYTFEEFPLHTILENYTIHTDENKRAYNDPDHPLNDDYQQIKNKEQKHPLEFILNRDEFDYYTHVYISPNPLAFLMRIHITLKGKTKIFATIDFKHEYFL